MCTVTDIQFGPVEELQDIPGRRNVPSAPQRKFMAPLLAMVWPWASGVNHRRVARDGALEPRSEQ